MNINSTKKVINKDVDKLEKNYAKGKVYIKGIVREQETIIKKSQSAVDKINNRLEKLNPKLEPYAKKEKEMDDKYIELKTEYSDLLEERAILTRTIQIAAESISEAKLHYLGGEDVPSDLD